MHQLSIFSFHRMIITGAEKLISLEQDLNQINVFPVADGDTGSNIAFLMKTIIRESFYSDASHALEKIKLACLRGSRGNSGMILSQFIISMCDYLQKHEKPNKNQFVEMCDLCVQTTYRAVQNPVEGTILTVMSDWLNSMKQTKYTANGIIELLEHSLSEANHSLEKTKNMHPLFQKHNVVDAGAKGFCQFIKGIIEGLRLSEAEDDARLSGVYEVATTLSSDYLSTSVHDASLLPELLEYRYCCEFLFEAKAPFEQLRKKLEIYGDSIVFVGDEKIGKIHVHSNYPDQIADLIQRSGNISYQKVEDMERQKEMIYHRKANIAIVADSACDLPPALMDQYQIHLLPLNVTIGNRNYLDKRTITPDNLYEQQKLNNLRCLTSLPSLESIEQLYNQLLQHYDHIISIHVSSKLSGTFAACNQVAEKLSKKRIHVVDSKTLSGAYALLVQDIAKYIYQTDGSTLVDIGEVLNEIDKQTKHTEILVTVPTLTNMVKSGRVSPIKGLAAKLLRIKPIVTVDEQGSSKLLRPSLLRSTNIPKLLKQIKKLHQINPIEKYVILYTDDHSKIEQLTQEMYSITGFMPNFVTSVSSVIGIHAGSGAYSIAMSLTNSNERSYIS